MDDEQVGAASDWLDSIAEDNLSNEDTPPHITPGTGWVRVSNFEPDEVAARHYGSRIDADPESSAPDEHTPSNDDKTKEASAGARARARARVDTGAGTPPAKMGPADDVNDADPFPIGRESWGGPKYYDNEETPKRAFMVPKYAMPYGVRGRSGLGQG